MVGMGHNASCRSCGVPLLDTFVDLGMSPLANSYLTLAETLRMEKFYPLHVYVCRDCFLVQLEQVETPEALFSDYAYFSSYSSTWLAHAREFAEHVIPRFALGSTSRVVEIASNDGYLLQYFLQRGIPALGIEPAANVAQLAIRKGIETRVEFFNTANARQMASEGLAADLLIGNNVLAHVPELHSFVEGLRIALKPAGVFSLEFPHLLQMLAHNQFDTIYHEHFSYFSLLAVERIFAQHDLVLFDVQELATHGGSLRVLGTRAGSPCDQPTDALRDLRRREREAGLDSLSTYTDFANRAVEVKLALLSFLIRCRREGRTTIAYGAPAKGNTLLNYCGIGPELIPFTVDRSPHKQSKYLPGTHIPIRHPRVILEARPDYVLILPWNLREEISREMAAVREWGGQFVVPIPELAVF